MALSLEQLRAFVETVESGSFRAAAAKIGKHASTVSELVAYLEIDLGFSLFERTRRTITLTSQGEQMYRFAVPVLREADLFVDKADSVMAEDPASLTLGIDPALRCPQISICYRQLVDSYPGLDLRVLSGDMMQILSWIRSGRVDLGLVPTTTKQWPDMTSRRAFNFALKKIINADYPLEGGKIELSQLRGMTQIAYSFMLQAGMEETHMLSHHKLEANNAHEIIEMVAAGLGWSLMPAFLARDHVELGRVQFFDTDEGRDDMWFSELLYLASRTVDPAMQCFIDAVQSIPDNL